MKFDTRYFNRTPRQGPCSGVVAQYKTDSVCALCVWYFFGFLCLEEHEIGMDREIWSLG